MPEARPLAELKDLFSHFQVTGELLTVTPHGTGHINDTYLGRFSVPGGEKRYILQRINHQVFKQPAQLMENVERVTRYSRERILLAGGDPDRETLNLAPTRDQGSFICSPQGEFWRVYHFIPRVRAYEVCPSPQIAYQAARAFGSFQTLLRSLPGERLHETIPGFHHTARRYAAFEEAVQADSAGRAAGCRAEIDFILKRAADANVVVDSLASGELPERVTHNDTKINNVLFDEESGEGICVIDLDTVMPGSILYDFGDLIRMGAASAEEDERDLTRVGIDFEMFTWLARGYLETVRDILVQREWELMAFAGRLITYEQALRFLGDYLRGDTYYKIHYPDHNLVRARNQIQMIVDMEAKRNEMEAIIDRLHDSL